MKDGTGEGRGGRGTNDGEYLRFGRAHLGGGEEAGRRRKEYGRR